MKIRLTHTSIRYRLTQPEVTLLSKGEKVVESIRYSMMAGLFFSLIPKAISYAEWDSIRQGSDVRLKLPLKDIEAWANSDHEGLYYRMPNGTDQLIDVSVEKDFACLKPRADEKDQFPNPNEGKTAC